jgi:hypothetical protein
VDVKMITDLVGSIGVPGAILLLGVWKLAPPLVRLVEGVTTSLGEIKTTLVEMKEEMKETNNRLSPAH